MEGGDLAPLQEQTPTKLFVPLPPVLLRAVCFVRAMAVPTLEKGGFDFWTWRRLSSPQALGRLHNLVANTMRCDRTNVCLGECVNKDWGGSIFLVSSFFISIATSQRYALPLTLPSPSTLTIDRPDWVKLRFAFPVSRTWRTQPRNHRSNPTKLL